VLQDIHAKCLTKNIAAVAVWEVEKLAIKDNKKRKYVYKINFSNALSLIKGNVLRFMLNMATKSLGELLITKISKATNAFRPERKYERYVKIRRVKYAVAYRPLC